MRSLWRSARPEPARVRCRPCGRSWPREDPPTSGQPTEWGDGMRIAVLKDIGPGERRVAQVPESCKKLIASGYEVSIEQAAGESAGYGDEEYREAGVTVQSDPASLIGAADLVLKVTAPAAGPGRNEIGWMRPGTIYLGSLMPLRNLEAVRALAARKITYFSTHSVPRTTRAQAMDTLSSMASITGYKGVLLAAVELNRYLPMLLTPAGEVSPPEGLRVRARLV